MLRKLAFLVACALVLCAGAASADKPVPVTIMTQNMDDGTDLTYVIAALLGQGFTVPEAVDLTFAELQASNFEERARLLAARIREKKPDFVALQEAVLWTTGPTASETLFDSLALLVTALQKAGAPYTVLAVQTVNILALPGAQVSSLGLFDRNALLMRADLRPPQLFVPNVSTHVFSAFLPFAGSEIHAGWIEADVRVGNRPFRLVTTHLQSPIPGVPEATDVQVAQAKELTDAMSAVTTPVIICGDFNSDANHGGFIDTTPTVDNIEAAGYEETWAATHGRGDLGLTWPLFLEDQYPAPPFVVETKPFERIDLFFSRGADAVRSERVLSQAQGRMLPPYGSDHAGVVATFRP